MKKLLIIAICLFGLSPFLKAQMLNLNYQISLPMNQVKDFTDKASFRGFDIEYHQFLGDQFSIGAAIGWDVFYKDKKHTPGNFRFNGNSNVYTIILQIIRRLSDLLSAWVSVPAGPRDDWK